MDNRQENNDARFLAEVMAFGSGAEGDLWRPQELAAILQHQLDAPLAFDLDTFQSGLAERVVGLCQGEGPPIRTFRELFHHPRPPVELLRLTKDFAKGLTSQAEASVPEPIAEILYTLSIVVAMTRCKSRITELGDEDLQRRIDWVSAQPWVDEPTHGLLREGRIAVHAPGAESVPGADATIRMSSSPRARLGQLGEYCLLEKLGEGGMGTVYKALHTELDRLVAVKVIRTSQFEGGWIESRFRREIKAVGRLDHPHIVRAYDARTIADTHFLVMEYVDGLDLNELVRRLGPLGIADACEIARQTALGLQCAHEHGLVHRDVKPSNVMLGFSNQPSAFSNQREKEGDELMAESCLLKASVKILDLGLARLHAPDLAGQTTATGLAMGTPDYMAPEQASDSHAVDIRADVYSLGCTVYMLLTGSEPFGGPEYRSLLAKMTAHRDQTPPPLHHSRGDVPKELSAVLDRMLAKSPEHRFATPAQVADALGPFSQGSDLGGLLAKAEGQPVEARAAEVRLSHEQPVGNALRGVPSKRRSHGTSWKRSHGTPRSAFPTGWTIAIGLALVVLAAGLFWFRAAWVARPERSDGRAESSLGLATPGVPEGTPLGVSKSTPGADWIVLSWTRPRLGKPNLWLFRPDGSRRVNVTNDPRYYDIHPKFSPDGRRIAFVRGESLTEPNGVYVCNANGSELRPLVTPRDKWERFGSPVWVSPSRIYYARDPKLDREPDMEAWQVDLDGSAPRKIFRFQDAVGQGGGLVTDVSPDRQRLVIIAQQGGSHVSADVYVTDLEGKGRQTVWVDKPDEWRDARALWSPDGSRIAWHHNFTRGMLKTPIYHGVGMARLDADGKWTARLQPTPEVFVTPLAWSPREGHLLCARMGAPKQKMPAATLCLMDEQFRTVRTLFELDSTPWQPGQRELGRLADWGIVPDDVAIAPGP